MTINEKLAEMLRWYQDIGITVAIGETPCNHYAPLRSIGTKNTLRELTAPMTPSSTIPVSDDCAGILGPRWGGIFDPVSTPRVGSLEGETGDEKTASDRWPKTGKIIGNGYIPPSSTKLSGSVNTLLTEPSAQIAQQCQTLEELKEALAQFEGCALKKTAMNLVFSDGNPKSKVMLVGEAPGADEDRQGLPFVGVSGQLLDRMLATIGLDRTSVYITNIVPWRPPGNRQPTPQEIAVCKPFVERHIALIHPKILVLVGGVSMKALLNTHEGIMRMRGTWRTYSSAYLNEPIKAIATYHPSFLLRSPAQKAQSWQDMLLIKKALTALG